MSAKRLNHTLTCSRRWDISDKSGLLVVAIFVVIVTLSAAFTLWLIGRLRRTSDQPPSRDMSGAVAVPVRRLKQFGWFSSKSDSFNPQIAIAPDGLHFKVFSVDYWPFTEIERVDVLRVPLVTRVAIRKRGGRLDVDVAGRNKARDLLRALPATLVYTPRAAALRDGSG